MERNLQGTASAATKPELVVLNKFGQETKQEKGIFAVSRVRGDLGARTEREREREGNCSNATSCTLFLIFDTEATITRNNHWFRSEFLDRQGTFPPQLNFITR